MGGAILVLDVYNERSANGQAPEEEGPGRRVQRSHLRLAPPNGIPFVFLGGGGGVNNFPGAKISNLPPVDSHWMFIYL